jgi:hypothetical protein
MEIGVSDIEDVQDKVDKLVLTVFEAVLGHKALILKSDDNDNPNKDLIDHHSKCIIQAYKDTLNSIDNLPGINKTRLQQEQELLSLSQQYINIKNDVTILENNVNSLHNNINNELQSLLDDDCINLKPS